MLHRMKMNSVLSFTIVAFLSLVTASSADEKEKKVEQRVARNFTELQQLVRSGDTLYVTDKSDHKVMGDFEEISTSRSELTLVVEGERRLLSEADVQQIQLKYSDSLKNGAVWGALVGGAAGAAICSSTECREEGSTFLGATLYTAGLGVAVGVVIDALHKGRRLVYSAPETAQEFRVSVSPMLFRGRKGVLVHFHF